MTTARMAKSPPRLLSRTGKRHWCNRRSVESAKPRQKARPMSNSARKSSGLWSADANACRKKRRGGNERRAVGAIAGRKRRNNGLLCRSRNLNQSPARRRQRLSLKPRLLLDTHQLATCLRATATRRSGSFRLHPPLALGHDPGQRLRGHPVAPMTSAAHLRSNTSMRREHRLPTGMFPTRWLDPARLEALHAWRLRLWELAPTLTLSSSRRPALARRMLPVLLGHPDGTFLGPLR